MNRSIFRTNRSRTFWTINHSRTTYSKNFVLIGSKFVKIFQECISHSRTNHLNHRIQYLKFSRFIFESFPSKRFNLVKIDSLYRICLHSWISDSFTQRWMDMVADQNVYFGRIWTLKRRIQGTWSLNEKNSYYANPNWEKYDERFFIFQNFSTDTVYGALNYAWNAWKVL